MPSAWIVINAQGSPEHDSVSYSKCIMSNTHMANSSTQLTSNLVLNGARWWNVITNREEWIVFHCTGPESREIFLLHITFSTTVTSQFMLAVVFFSGMTDKAHNGDFLCSADNIHIHVQTSAALLLAAKSMLLWWAAIYLYIVMTWLQSHPPPHHHHHHLLPGISFSGLFSANIIKK